MLRLGKGVDAAKPLAGYGLNSLSGVELRNWLRTALSAELTLFDVLQARTMMLLVVC
jgi:hypothetical protein